MSRFRSISDNFWEDPAHASLTTEEKFTLAFLLTNSKTSTTGLYRVVWRVLGAGLGWTQEQMVAAIANLDKKQEVVFDEKSGWLWILCWWRHNSLRGAFTGNLKKNAIKEISQVPDSLKENVWQWLSDNDEDGALEGLRSPSGGAPDALPSNPTPIPIPTPTPTPPAGVGGDGRGWGVDELLEATIEARSKTADPVKQKSGWEKWARSKAAAGDFSPLEQGRQLLTARKASKEAEERIEAARAKPLPCDEAAFAAGAEVVARARQKRDAA